MANITDEQRQRRLRKAIEANKDTIHFRSLCYILDGELYETGIKIMVMEENKESEDK